MGNFLDQGPQEIFHLATLTPGWIILANVGILASMFKNTSIGYYVHMILLWLVIIVTLISPVYYLVHDGLQGICDLAQPDCDRFHYSHTVIGLVLVLIILIQAGLGIFTRAWLQNPKASSLAILRVKKVHHVFGYILLLLGKINVILKWRETIQILIPIIVWQAICISAWIFLKFFSLTFQETVVDQRIFEKKIIIPRIKYLQELTRKGKNSSPYAIFGNYVYDITPLISLHPAGYQVIEWIRGRQVDRFIYGMYSSQANPQVDRFSHPASSLKLLGQPVAKIDTINPYKNMQNFMIQMIKQNPLEGFVQSIISARSTVRNEIMNTQESQLNMNKGLQKNFGSNEIMQLQSISSENSIPLMIKVYPKGDLTPKLIKQQQKPLQISYPKGQGLKLDILQPGALVFISGGTGFYPFMDLVDLLYKQRIIQQNKIDKNIQQRIINSDPILSQNIFNNFQFIFYIAMNSTQDLHPMSLYQLNYLSSFGNFKCTLRISGNDQLSKIFKNFKFTNDSFTNIAQKDITDENTRKSFICGPPIMLECFVKLIKEKNLNENKYQFV